MSERGFTPKLTQCITLINGMCRMGDLQGAFKLRDEMEALQVSPCDVVESAMVRGLALCLCARGDVMAALELYEEIKQRGLWPNTTPYTVLIDAISKEENFVKGELLLEDLQERKMISWDWDESTQHLHEGLMIALQKFKSFCHKRKKGCQNE
ncbi:hypothetical protein Patl1_03916 [Pistacia atlantica]|uniref:Uncharacterized protein n=1 Tax=Pistacia atlantica TaxID=434234 RepID=A0ACC1BWY8_9ROSI|nr:hypothetical protein Patl1_03916 [Pistacia atlantica]